MFNLYILQPNYKVRPYIKRSSDLKRYIIEHYLAKYSPTKSRNPSNDVFCEAYTEVGDIKTRGKYLKATQGHQSTKRIPRQRFITIEHQGLTK